MIYQFYIKAEFGHAVKGLVLPRASHSSEIALASLHRLRCTLAVDQASDVKGEAFRLSTCIGTEICFSGESIIAVFVPVFLELR